MAAGTEAGIGAGIPLRPGITDGYLSIVHPIERPVIPRPLSECFDADADAYR